MLGLPIVLFSVTIILRSVFAEDLLVSEPASALIDTDDIECTGKYRSYTKVCCRQWAPEDGSKNGRSMQKCRTFDKSQWPCNDPASIHCCKSFRPENNPVEEFTTAYYCAGYGVAAETVLREERAAQKSQRQTAAQLEQQSLYSDRPPADRDRSLDFYDCHGNNVVKVCCEPNKPTVRHYRLCKKFDIKFKPCWNLKQVLCCQPTDPYHPPRWQTELGYLTVRHCEDALESSERRNAERTRMMELVPKAGSRQRWPTKNPRPRRYSPGSKGVRVVPRPGSKGGVSGVGGVWTKPVEILKPPVLKGE